MHMATGVNDGEYSKYTFVELAVYKGSYHACALCTVLARRLLECDTRPFQFLMPFGSFNRAISLAAVH